VDSGGEIYFLEQERLFDDFELNGQDDCLLETNPMPV